ncbi:MAG TPA: PP2C family protein-serine/threonine phosphatase [Thermoanaerobaculia bacterium]|nr:PP2C family protein-serine/threonine phosphatase [Thermoanaerobaculia bacterium]
MENTGRTRKVSLLLAIGGGLLSFAIGTALALAFLPEWRAGRVPGERLFLDRFREIARQVHLPLDPGEPAVSLRTWNTGLEQAYRNLGEEGARWLASSRTGLVVRVSHPADGPGVSPRGDLEVFFSLDGSPQRITWGTNQPASPVDLDPERFERFAATLRPLLLNPGESLGRSRHGTTFMGVFTWRMHEIVGSAPAQHLFINVLPPTRVLIERRPSRPGGLGEDLGSLLRRVLVAGFTGLPIILAVAGTFLALLLRARISLVNGALLGLVTLVSCHPAWLTRELPDLGPGFQAKLVWFLDNAPMMALSVLLVWSAGESLLRSQSSGFTTSLDTLRVGRLGPRGGRALLLGCAVGAALAGIWLGVRALAVVLPGISPAGAGILPVPFFRTDGSPVADGISLAAGVTLALAVVVRFLPERWVLPAAALLAGWALSPLEILPYPAELIANVAVAGLLVWVCRRFGLTALLVASVVSLVLPAAVLSGQHLSWMPGTFAITLALPVGIVLLGVAGLSRPEKVESDPLRPPAFIRRLEAERSFRHEVDLLARMQAGLLPRELPRIEGYDLAARSVLASEAGGDLYDFLRDEAGHLWIAAGDVAGHGYSCAIAQAMIKGGLVSLIALEESPAGMLRQLHRVLQGASTDHSFTSLALLRLDPGTGDAVVANAAYPYPLLFADGKVTEIELPGLPLGHGPARTYADRAFHLAPRSALALCSDGLFEVLDRNGNAYGFERAREVLQAIGHRPAVEIVDALLNDCRRHLGGGDLPDDVTVVVVRRG